MHLAQMRPGGGEIQPKEIKYVVGRKVVKDMPRGAQLKWEDLS
jgi:sialic acid synthase SpsE